MRGNRQTLPGHVQKLMSSIAAPDMGEVVPILVNEKMEIIDGQHRLEARKKLALPIYYIIQSKSTVKDVQLLNSSQRAWTLADYVASYRSEGNPHYETLTQFYTEHDIPISQAVSLLSKKNRENWSTPIARMKDGQFVVDSLEEATEVMKHMKIFQPYITRVIYRSKGFINAIRFLHESPDFNWERLASKLEESPFRILYALNKKDYLYSIEKIYNYKEKRPVRIYS